MVGGEEPSVLIEIKVMSRESYLWLSVNISFSKRNTKMTSLSLTFPDHVYSHTNIMDKIPSKSYQFLKAPNPVY